MLRGNILRGEDRRHRALRLTRIAVDAFVGVNVELVRTFPTAAEDTLIARGQDGHRELARAGARNVVVLHTRDRRMADSDSFVNVLNRARGVWITGGRQGRLVDAYHGSRVDSALRALLVRGGVIGGTSAGASIMGSYLVRGSPHNEPGMMVNGYEKGLGWLRGVAIDQHIIARNRQRHLADSVIARHPEFLGIGLDEGTAIIVRGDTATATGRGIVFVTNGREPVDPGTPYRTLRPGSRYDLHARKELPSHALQLAIPTAMVDSLFGRLLPGDSVAIHLVSGEVVVASRTFGLSPDPRGVPSTSVPAFALGGIADSFARVLVQLLIADSLLTLRDTLPMPGAISVEHYLTQRTADHYREPLAELLNVRTQRSYADLLTRRLMLAFGARQARVLGSTGDVLSNVDDLYRWELALRDPDRFVELLHAAKLQRRAGARLDATVGWDIYTEGGLTRYSMYGTPQKRRSVFTRIPACGISVIVLSNRESFDAGAAADALVRRVLAAKPCSAR